jgi:hypothetical protein
MAANAGDRLTLALWEADRHAQGLGAIASASELLQAYRNWAAWLRARSAG